MIPIGKGQVQIVEIRISMESPVIGKKLWEINLPNEVIIGCIMRDKQTIIPRGDTRVCENDILVVLLESTQEMAVIKELTGR